MARQAKKVDPKGDDVRVVLRMKPSEAIRLDDMREKLGENATRAHVIRQALQVYEWILDEDNQVFVGPSKEDLTKIKVFASS